MKVYTFMCSCGCPDPLTVDVDGRRMISVFSSKEAAQISAAETFSSNPLPLIREIEIKAL